MGLDVFTAARDADALGLSVAEDPDVHLEYLHLQVHMLVKAKTPRERVKQEAALDLAYANLACSSYRKPSRAMFRDIALWRYGWTSEDFNTWADCPYRTEWIA